MAGSEHPNPNTTRARRATALVAVVILLTAAALVIPEPSRPARSPSPTPSLPDRTSGLPVPSPSAATGILPGTSPMSVPDAAWAPLSLEPYVPVADLVATNTDVAGIAPDTTFVLRSRGSEPAQELASRVTVEPAVALKVAGTSSQPVIRPAARLTPGQSYRFVLRDPTGALQGSWAFRVRQPLHVVATLPRDKATDVPLDTGIEFTFDQDGATGAAARFTIDPSVPGSFEMAGRTFVFKPRALRPRTVYRVTLRRGVQIAGSDQVLEQDVSFAFETTSAASASTPTSTIYAGRLVFESSTREAPVMSVSTYGGSDVPMPTSVKGAIHRFPGSASALAALAQAERGTWTRWQGQAGASATNLPRVASFTVHASPLETNSDVWFRLPSKLAAGWYLVVLEDGADRVSLFLQVSDIGSFVAVFSDRIAVWAHDLRTSAPLAGATVTIGTDGALGSTDAQGLLVAPVPASLRSSADSTGRPILTIASPDGRTGFVAGSMWTGGGDGWRYATGAWWYGGANDAYWQFFHADRQAYRQQDTLNAFGLVRRRADGSIPTRVTVRLVDSGGAENTTPAISEATVTTDPIGAFTASLRLRDVPMGWYALELRDGGTLVNTTYVTVTVLTKPPYRLELSTDRHVYLADESVRLTATATFYDGTPVGGLELRIAGANGLAVESNVTVTTDPTGKAAFTLPARRDESPHQFDVIDFQVEPVRSEEMFVSATAYVVVWAGLVELQATPSFAGSTLSVAGTIYRRDMKGAEAWYAAGSPYGDDGKTASRAGPSAGSTVTVNVTGSYEVARRTGERYDFIARKVVPVYDYDLRTVDLGTRKVKADASGRFALSVRVTDARISSCSIRLSARDAASRETAIDLYASPSDRPHPGLQNWAYLDDGRPSDDPGYHVGDTVSLVFRDTAGPYPSSAPNQYLFMAAQLGLRSLEVRSSPTFAVPFDAAAVPNLVVNAVRFTGSTYIFTGSSYLGPSGYQAQFDARDRALDVTATPSAPSYRPGGTASVDIAVASAADGRPVPADVIVTAVDQKLYDMYAAWDAEPLGQLYSSVSSGMLLSRGSHQYPDTGNRGGGSTGGGGGGGDLRDDFRDAAFFGKVAVGSDGRARITFRVPDDLTQWHVAVYAVTGDLRAGSTDVPVVVSLPFFVEATIAPEYVAGDRPAVRLRAYGDALRAGQTVTYAVSSSSLGMAVRTVTAPAFRETSVTLPAVPLGTQRLTIRATVDAAGGGLADGLVRTFTVVRPRQTRDRLVSSRLGPGFVPSGGDSTTYTFADAGRGAFLPLLWRLMQGDGPRLDQALAASEAAALVSRYFPGLAKDVPATTLDFDRYAVTDPDTSRLALALLPYASGDLELTVRALLLAPASTRGSSFEESLSAVVNREDEALDRRLLALAGLAALGSPVVTELRAAANDDENFSPPTPLLYAALGLAAAGDEQGARAIERRLLQQYGERYGTYVRLRVSGDASQVSEATALLAALAAALGDPLAPAAEAYAEANPSQMTVFGLQQVAYAAAALERTSPATARFAVTVGGRRTEHVLKAGQSWSITLSATQRVSLAAQLLSGEVAVMTVWRETLEPTAVVNDPDLSIERFVWPGLAVPADAVVDVTLRVDVRGIATSGCFRVTEIVPSGLVPRSQPWGIDVADAFTWPSLVDGQRVEFFVCDPSRPPRYLATVLTAGTYAWEPAIVARADAPERIAITPPAKLAIG